MDLTRCLVLLVFLVLVIFGLAMLIFYSGRKPKVSTTDDKKETSQVTPKYSYGSYEKDSDRRLRKANDQDRKDMEISESELEKRTRFPEVPEKDKQVENQKNSNEKKEDSGPIPLILDKIEENALSWSYESEGRKIDVTKNENVSNGITIFVHSIKEGSFTLEEVKFGGKSYPVPPHEKVLSVHTYGFKSDPSFVYYILVYDNIVCKVYKNDGKKFVFDMGTHDFRSSMERMATRLGRDFDSKRLFNLTALGNFDFGSDEINVTRDKINEKYIAIIITNLYGNIVADGYTANGKEQYGLPAGRPYCSIVVYYQVDSNAPLLVKFIESGEINIEKFYRNDSCNTWKSSEFLDLEKHLDQVTSLLSLSSRLEYYVDLFTQKEQIKIDVTPVVNDNTYSFMLIDKLKVTQTTYLFVFEYLDYIRNIVEVPMLSSLRFIGSHEKPSVPGYWNHVKIDETNNEVVRYYTPIYIEVERRRIHFLVRIYMPNDLFPDGGKFTRYLDKLHINQPIRVQASTTKYKFLSENLFDGLEKTVEFDTLNLAAGGTGITPFIRILNYYQNLPFNINMVICAQTAEEVLLKPLFDRFTRINYRLHVTYLILDEDRAPEGMVSTEPKEVISSRFENRDKALSLICGQLAFGDYIYNILKDLNFKNIYYL